MIPPTGRLREKTPWEGLAHDVAHGGISQIWGLPQKGFNRKKGLK